MMSKSLLEKIVIIALLTITLVGVWSILISEYRQIDKRYFDDPGYKDTENIALYYEQSLYINKCPNPLSTECILVV